MENDVFLGYSWEMFGEFLDYSDDIDQKHQVLYQNSYSKSAEQSEQFSVLQCTLRQQI